MLPPWWVNKYISPRDLLLQLRVGLITGIIFHLLLFYFLNCLFMTFAHFLSKPLLFCIILQLSFIHEWYIRYCKYFSRFPFVFKYDFKFFDKWKISILHNQIIELFLHCISFWFYIEDSFPHPHIQWLTCTFLIFYGLHFRYLFFNPSKIYFTYRISRKSCLWQNYSNTTKFKP